MHAAPVLTICYTILLHHQYNAVLASVNKAVGAAADDDGELKRVAEDLQIMIKKVQGNMVDKTDFLKGATVLVLV